MSKIEINSEDFDTFINAIMLDSIEIFREEESRTDYIQDKQVTTLEKVHDLDNLIQWAEAMEMYEDCGNLLNMKNQIIGKS